MQGNTFRQTTTLATPRAATLSVFPWGRYDGVLKQALALIKYDNQASLGFWLGCQLGLRWKQQKRPDKHGQKPPVVIPIPLHSQRLKQRGYNQAAVIAQGFCRATGFSLAEHGLIRTKATVAMHGLGAQARCKNLTNAFHLGKGLPVKGVPILLLDDIYTTGSTVHAASVPLIEKGHTVAGVTAVARAVFATQLDRPNESDPAHQIPNWHPTL